MMTDTNRGDDFLAPGEAARLLGVDTSTLRRWADDGKIIARITEGGHRRFRRADVESLAKGGDAS